MIAQVRTLVDFVPRGSTAQAGHSSGDQFGLTRQCGPLAREAKVGFPQIHIGGVIRRILRPIRKLQEPRYALRVVIAFWYPAHIAANGLGIEWFLSSRRISVVYNGRGKNAANVVWGVCAI